MLLAFFPQSALFEEGALETMVDARVGVHALEKFREATEAPFARQLLHEERLVHVEDWGGDRRVLGPMLGRPLRGPG